MIYLNLLPLNQREELKIKKSYLLIENLTAFFLILIILSAIILLISKNILKRKFNDLVIQTTNITKEYKKYNKDIDFLNKQLTYMQTAQKGFIPWSKVLVYLSQITPQNITLKSLALSSGKEKTAKIIGQAKKRENLITFKENLEKSNIFIEVKYPISNFLIQENVDFEFNAKLKINEF